MLALALQDPADGRVMAWRQQWERFQSKEPAFAQRPSVRPPYVPGKLDDGAVAEALAFLNLAREIAGVPADIQIDPALQSKCQIGAMVLAAAEQMTHQPRKPDGLADATYLSALETLGQSNLSYRLPGESLRQSLVGQLLDDDTGNLASVGHRRWLLNPWMKTTGFGQAVTASGDGSYSVVFAFDQSRETAFAKEVVSWPAPGSFPVELISPRMPWSISLNEEVLRPPEDGAIEVVIRAKGKSWTLRPTNAGQPSRTAAFARICRQGYGMPFALVFRPEATVAWEAGDTIQVQVTGLKREDGSPFPLTYTTTLVQLRAT